MIQIQLYHHRSRKVFERWCKKMGIDFRFDGYGCGYYDPFYFISDSKGFEGCPVSVWDENSVLLYEKVKNEL